MLRLVDVDGDNWITDLHVSSAQQEDVLDAFGILARAYAYRDEGSRAFFVYDDDTPVGMGLYCDYPDLDSYELNQFFIDERYQGRGYGQAAVKLIMEEMRQKGKYRKVVLWCFDENDAAKMFYEHIGFAVTGTLQDEIEMSIDL